MMMTIVTYDQGEEMMVALMMDICMMMMTIVTYDQGKDTEDDGYDDV